MLGTSNTAIERSSVPSFVLLLRALPFAWRTALDAPWIDLTDFQNIIEKADIQPQFWYSKLRYMVNKHLIINHPWTKLRNLIVLWFYIIKRCCARKTAICTQNGFVPHPLLNTLKQRYWRPEISKWNGSVPTENSNLFIVAN